MNLKDSTFSRIKGGCVCPDNLRSNTQKDEEGDVRIHWFNKWTFWNNVGESWQETKWGYIANQRSSKTRYRNRNKEIKIEK